MSVTVPTRGGAVKAPGASRRLGQVARCTDDATGTDVTVLGPDGSALVVHLAQRGDEAAARRLRASFRRLSWACLELHDDGPRATVRGVRNRLPVTEAVSVPVALALSGQGLPTVVVAA